MIAQYSDLCPSCWETIHEGTPIRRSSDDTAWVHVECPDGDDLTATNPICSACFLDHPEGTCDR